MLAIQIDYPFSDSVITTLEFDFATKSKTYDDHNVTVWTKNILKEKWVRWKIELAMQIPHICDFIWICANCVSVAIFSVRFYTDMQFSMRLNRNTNALMKKIRMANSYGKGTLETMPNCC